MHHDQVIPSGRRCSSRPPSRRNHPRDTLRKGWQGCHPYPLCPRGTHHTWWSLAARTLQPGTSMRSCRTGWLGCYLCRCSRLGTERTSSRQPTRMCPACRQCSVWPVSSPSPPDQQGIVRSWCYACVRTCLACRQYMGCWGCYPCQLFQLGTLSTSLQRPARTRPLCTAYTESTT